jgi:hypothetical protein
LECGGVGALYTILTTLNETSILGRGSRVVGNAAQDKDVRVKLLSVGVLGALVKNLAEVSAPAAKSSIIRAIRLFSILKLDLQFCWERKNVKKIKKPSSQN